MSRLTLFGTIPLFISVFLYFLGFVIWLIPGLKNIIIIPYESLLTLMVSDMWFFSYILLSVFFVMIVVDFLVSLFVAKPENIRHKPIKKPRISVVMTAWNDEKAIGHAVRDFKKRENVMEVVVVENNSTDNTAEVARKAGARVITEKKPGYGRVCIRGLKEVSPEANIVVLVEGDMTFNGYDVKKLVPYLDNVDMVLGTRTTQELLNQKTQLGWFTVWGNLFMAKLIQLKYWDFKMWGRVRLTDVGCTLRAVRRESLKRIINDLKVETDHFSPHMIMVSLNKKLKVIEIPVTFKERIGVSKGAGGNNWKAFKVGLRMLFAIFFY